MIDNTSKRNALGDSPLHQALLNKNVNQVLKALYHDNVPLTDINYSEMNCMHLLATICNDPIFTDKCMELFFEALDFNEEHLCHLLLMRDCVGQTPLHIAISQDNAFLFHAIEKLGIQTQSLICDLDYYKSMLKNSSRNVCGFFANSLHNNTEHYLELKIIAETFGSLEFLNILYDNDSLAAKATEALSDQQIDAICTLPSPPPHVELYLIRRHQEQAKRLATEALWSRIHFQDDQEDKAEPPGLN